jgi:hypothetical protein
MYIENGYFAGKFILSFYLSLQVLGYLWNPDTSRQTHTLKKNI